MDTRDHGRSNILASARTCMTLNDKILFLMAAGAVLGAAVPILGPVEFGDFVSNPSSPTMWIAFLVGAPTLILLIKKDPKEALGLPLRALWSLSFIAFAVHVWFGGDTPPGPALNVPLVAGLPASAVLLTVMWAVTVWSAWTRPDVIWPQAIILLILGGSTIVTTYQSIATTHTSAPYIQWLCGGLFAVAVGVATRARIIKLTKDIAALSRSPSGTLSPTPPDVTVAMLAQQALRDLQGKEVQCAATYSYLWLADQVGHFGLGMALSIFLGQVVLLVFSHQQLGYFIGFAIAAAGVCLWEVNAYRAASREASGLFPIDKKLLWENAVIAALYMLLGTIEGWACRQPYEYQIPILLAVSFLAVVAAKPWVRQKIIWQKAGLPYLFRLADAQHTILEPAATNLQDMVVAAAPPGATAQQFVIAGPVNSGRTLLACGIGTELAFRDKKVRYVSLDRLIEFATAPQAASIPPTFGDDLGPSNICFWPWTEAQVLVIDDIGPVLGPAEERDLEILLNTKLKQLQGCMADRHTVWIMGDLGSGAAGEARLQRYATVIRRFCDGKQETTRILLETPPPKTECTGRLAA